MAMRTRWWSGTAGTADELDAVAPAGSRIEREICTCTARPLLDDRRTEPPPIELFAGEVPLEFESHAIVLDCQDAAVLTAGQPDDDAARAAVLAHVDQRFLRD